MTKPSTFKKREKKYNSEDRKKEQGKFLFTKRRIHTAAVLLDPPQNGGAADPKQEQHCKKKIWEYPSQTRGGFLGKLER